MLSVKILDKIYQAEQIPTTQEDNAGGIVDRWILWQDNEPIGRMAQWFYNQGFVTVVDGVRTVYAHDEITFFSN